MKHTKTYLTASLLLLLLPLAGCKDSESYSDLLKEEQEAVNWYLAGQRVETEIPEDNKFIEGEDAPYYRMDADGYIYMQVIRSGNAEPKPAVGDQVYFRFRQKNIKYMYMDYDEDWSGNADNLTPTVGPSYFVLGDTSSDNAVVYGSGIQLPLYYVGYDSEVNLVLRSYYGFYVNTSSCVPYLINIKYFKAEY